MLKLYFFVSESEINVLFNKVQPEVYKDFDFYPAELWHSQGHITQCSKQNGVILLRLREP